MLCWIEITSVPKRTYFSDGFEVNFDFVILAQHFIFVASFWESSHLDFCAVSGPLWFPNCSVWVGLLIYGYVSSVTSFCDLLRMLPALRFCDTWGISKICRWVFKEVITQDSVLAFKWLICWLIILHTSYKYCWWLRALTNLFSLDPFTEDLGIRYDFVMFTHCYLWWSWECSQWTFIESNRDLSIPSWFSYPGNHSSCQT